MASPTRPASGDPITSEWGNAVIDQTQARWRFVRLAPNVVSEADGNTTVQTVECTTLPANDPFVVAAQIGVEVKVNSGTAGNAGANNQSCTALDFDGTAAGKAWTPGTYQRYSASGPFPVKVGGVNGRQIKHQESVVGTGAHYILTCYGYWTTADA